MARCSEGKTSARASSLTAPSTARRARPTRSSIRTPSTPARSVRIISATAGCGWWAVTSPPSTNSLSRSCTGLCTRGWQAGLAERPATRLWTTTRARTTGALSTARWAISPWVWPARSMHSQPSIPRCRQRHSSTISRRRHTRRSNIRSATQRRRALRRSGCGRTKGRTTRSAAASRNCSPEAGQTFRLAPPSSWITTRTPASSATGRAFISQVTMAAAP